MVGDWVVLRCVIWNEVGKVFQEGSEEVVRSVWVIHSLMYRKLKLTLGKYVKYVSVGLFRIRIGQQAFTAHRGTIVKWAYMQ